MTARKNVKKWLIYPEDKYKTWWDLFMTFILLLTCIMTPYIIAFLPKEPLGIQIMNYIVDTLFLIDIVVIFFTAYYDEDVKIIDNRKKIARNYAKGWFIIDLLAIIPIDVIL